MSAATRLLSIARHALEPAGSRGGRHLLCVTDHVEPVAARRSSPARERARLNTQLGDLTAQGLGEIELHLHHGHDTSESLRAKLEKGIALFNRHGALITSETGRRAYAFIHGNMALDNAMGGPSLCGAEADRMHSHLVRQYRDRPGWRLHYVTARQPYQNQVGTRGYRHGA